MEAILLELERENLKEINSMVYLVLGEGAGNIFVPIHVAANSFFICSRVTIAKCPRWELSPGNVDALFDPLLLFEYSGAIIIIYQ